MHSCLGLHRAIVQAVRGEMVDNFTFVKVDHLRARTTAGFDQIRRLDAQRRVTWKISMISSALRSHQSA
jgi:hypothetical protein